MAIIKSKTKPNDDLFLSNKAAMEKLVNKLHSDIETIRQGGGEKAILHQRNKGKLPVRERVKILLDDESEFLEIGQFAAWEVYEEPIPCAGVVAGIGKIEGIQCMVIANDPSVKGGTYYPLTVKTPCERRRLHSAADYPAFIWSIRAAPTSHISLKYSQTKSTLDESFSIRPECQPKAFRKLPL